MMDPTHHPPPKSYILLLHQTHITPTAPPPMTPPPAHVLTPPDHRPFRGNTDHRTSDRDMKMRKGMVNLGEEDMMPSPGRRREDGQTKADTDQHMEKKKGMDIGTRIIRESIMKKSNTEVCMSMAEKQKATTIIANNAHTNHHASLTNASTTASHPEETRTNHADTMIPTPTAQTNSAVQPNSFQENSLTYFPCSAISYRHLLLTYNLALLQFPFFHIF